MTRRFITMDDVAEMLDVSRAQAYALVRSGDLPAIKVGGRGQWRIEVVKLEEYIERMYAQTAAWVRSNPLGGDGGPSAGDVDDAVVDEPEQ